MVYLNPTPYPSQPLCAACGKHPVARKGQLCNSAEDKGIWHCAEWSAAFVAPFLGVRWGENSACDEYVAAA